MKKIVLIVLIILVTTGCGFRTLESFNKETFNNFNTSIQVTSFDKAPREATLALHTTLDELLNNPNSPNKYYLNIFLSKKTDSYETQSNTVNLRTRVIIKADYTFTDIHTNEVLIKDQIVAIDSYQESESPYSTLVSSEVILTKMMKSIANEIKLRIISKML